ncbi:hypothetical protein PROFUN_09264 [Planoprotostelium fungivorum]|uniref:PCI domain-containing protein n=1 Tax=Planoprotostelium fungivorum TaxID=1890364 RepID=A0A2P6NKU9_9EUKA|nr:hypothetical protein PROFUN_09264 [Planoprotostelium fungivorum]
MSTEEVKAEGQMSYTEASYKSKGDKSYYYWHPNVSKSIPKVGMPELLEKVTITVPTAPTYKQIINYSWLDDGEKIKVYIEYAKVGDSKEEVGEVLAEKINCTFAERGFDLLLSDFKKEHHQLKISNLKEKIDPTKSTHRCLKSKIIVTLHKLDKETKTLDRDESELVASDHMQQSAARLKNSQSEKVDNAVRVVSRVEKMKGAKIINNLRNYNDDIDAAPENLPNQTLSEYRFLLHQKFISDAEKAEIKSKLLAAIKADNVLPFYQIVASELGWSEDTELVNTARKANEETLKTLDDKIKDAQENLGESEVRDAMEAKAAFFSRIGEKEKAISQYKLTLEKTIGFGQKLDIVFNMFRIGLFWNDHTLIKRHLDQAKSMIEQGSDWDRRNRLKVYEALYLMSIREFKKSALLFLDTISTFTAVELLDYDTFIFYTVLMCTVALDRVTIKNKVINAPEILTSIGNIPNLQTLLKSFYECNYAPFLVALADITDVMKRNRYLSAHAEYFSKEMRVLAYSQMLESYKSVQLTNMANAFGVSPNFLDKELSRFIASGRLHAKIDKVGGIVETNRPDSKNAQYQSTIKQGDLMLNRIQKLSRVINL